MRICICVSFTRRGSFAVEREERGREIRRRAGSGETARSVAVEIYGARVAATCLWLVGEKLAWFGPPSHLSVYAAARLSHPRLRAKGRQGFGSIVGWRRRHRRVGKRDEETGGGGGGSHSLEGREEADGKGGQRGKGSTGDGRGRGRGGEGWGGGGATVYASRVG